MAWVGVSIQNDLPELEGKPDEDASTGSKLCDLELEDVLDSDPNQPVSIGGVGGPAKFRYIKTRKYVRRLYIVLAALAAIFIFSTLLRVATKKSNRYGNDMDMSGSTVRESQLLGFMNGMTTDEAALSDLAKANSSQRQALRWLANEDPLAIDIPKIATDISYSVFLQRYSVAVMAFEWGVDLLKPLGFLTGSHECNWNANYMRSDTTTVQMGIICDDQKQVVQIVLQTLGLGGNIPREIGNLQNVTHLHLDSNKFTGPLPSQMGRMEVLRQLTATRNSLSGLLPGFLGISTSLTHIDLSYNAFSGDLFSAFNETTTDYRTDDNAISEIQFLGLDHNALTGSLPTSIKALTNLEELYLKDNNLNGHLYDHFQGLEKLAIVDLSENQMQGHCPDYLLELPSMTILDLHSNSFSGQFYHGNATKLAYLDIHDNKINNVMPRSIGSHPSLAFLDMSENLFTGLLPTEIAKLTKLRYLFIAQNTGLDPAPLPDWLSDLPLLTAVSFENTNRIGELPTFLWRLNQLTMLNLQSNSFNSTIPNQLHKMSSMEHLFLSRNQLTGSVPTQMGNMTELVLLNIDHNQITGTIENPICELDLEVFVADCLPSNTSSEALIECDCCTECCAPEDENCNTKDWSQEYELDWGGYYQRYNVLEEGEVFQSISSSNDTQGRN